MSKYGRLWQETSDYRGRIENEFRNPLPRNFSPADVMGRLKRIEVLVASWESTEEAMKREPE